MKVILKKDVSGLGGKKDIVEVAEGYARNFLIPKGLVLKAAPGNMKIIDEEKKREAKKREKEKKVYQQLARKIESLSCTITVKAGDDSRLFGSVTVQDVADALLKEGVPVDKKKILLEEPIKKLGIYHIEVKIHPEVKAAVKVWVVKE